MGRVARQNVWRTRAATDFVERRWIERGVEGGQQCSHETGADPSGGRARNEKVQKFGSDVELHEFGRIGRAICSEGSAHKNGESDSRQLEEVEESKQISERSRDSDVEDGTVEKGRSGERGRAFGFELGQWS